ncbi:uncharacterized protein LOC144567635 [Carex rostrata]
MGSGPSSSRDVLVQISEDVWRQLHLARDISPGRDWAYWYRSYVQLASAIDPPIADEHRHMDVPPVPYRDWYQECGAYTVYLEGCITDNPHERAPRPRDRRGRVHGIIPAGAPFASTALYLVKSCVIAATMATVRGWKRLGKAILKHNVPAVCQCGYKTRLDSLLRCAGLPGCDQIDDISDEPDIYVRYGGDEALWASVQDAQTVGQAFDRGQETLRRRAAEQATQEQAVPTQEQAVSTQEQIPTQFFSTQEERLGFNIDLNPDGLYSPGYVPTQSIPPAYLPGFTMPHPFPHFPGSSQPTQYPPIPDFAGTSTQYHPGTYLPDISIDDPIVRAAYGMFPTQESGNTVAFGPAVQHSAEIEEVEAVESDDSLDHTPLAVRIKGLRTRKARRPFTPSDF